MTLLYLALALVLIFLITGLGVKAALIPLHAWLPMAMVAPAPISALLHAVAVVKVGAFGIVRVVYEVFGVEFAALAPGYTAAGHSCRGDYPLRIAARHLPG